MQRVIVLALWLGCAIGGAAARPVPEGGRQADGTRSPAFDVVSIRRNTSASGAPTSRVEGRRYVASNFPLQQLIADAYRMPIVGGPDWIRSMPGPVTGPNEVRFDVVATLPPDAQPAQVPLMLQSALVERFKLVAHITTEQRQAYALVPARGDKRLGPRLTHSTQQCQMEIEAGPLRAPVRRVTDDGRPECGLMLGPGGIRGGGLTLRFLANALGAAAGRIVVDHTGLDGAFDFELTYAPSGRGGNPPISLDDRPSVFIALQEQLGLTLEPSVEPVESLIIDQVSMPTNN